MDRQEQENHPTGASGSHASGRRASSRRAAGRRAAGRRASGRRASGRRASGLRAETPHSHHAEPQEQDLPATRPYRAEGRSIWSEERSYRSELRPADSRLPELRPADSHLPEPRSSEPPLAESRPSEPRSSETPQVSKSIPVRVTLLADFVALLGCVAFTAVFILTSGFPISFPPTGTAAWVTAGLAFLSGVLAVYAITARAKIPNPHLARGLAWAMLAIATIAGALGKISAMPVLAGMGVVIVFLAQMARPVPAGTLVSQLAVSYLAIAVAISAGLWPASLHLVGGEMAGTIMAESLLCMAVVRVILGRIASWWPYLLVAFAGGLGAGWAYSTITGATAWATLTAGPVWLAIIPALLYPLADYYSGVLAEKLSLASPQTTAEEKTAGEDGVGAPAVENSETTKTARARETSRARENEASENNATGRAPIGWLTQAGVELAVVSVCGWLAFGIAAIIA